MESVRKLFDRQRRKYENHMTEIPSERERALELQDVMNRHSLCIDLSGKIDHTPGIGCGYVEEIARRIANEVRASGNVLYPLLVVIDYAGIMATRYMTANSAQMSELRHTLADIPRRVVQRIAGPYRCPVWILHQFSGASNTKRAHYRDHTDAAECKSLAENVDFAFDVGKPDPEENLTTIKCTKHRRMPALPERVIRVNGRFHRVEDVSHDYTRENGVIMSRALLGLEAPADTAADDRYSSRPFLEY
jgi:hypothetical protein